MAERDSGFGIGPDAACIRPTMAERCRHAARKRFELMRSGESGKIVMKWSE